ILREAPDKEYAPWQCRNSSPQVPFERQVGSELFRNRNHAAGANRPKGTERVESVKALSGFAQGSSRLESQPFHPDRQSIRAFDRGRKSERALRPLFPRFLSTKHANFPTNRRRPGVDLQRES